MVYKNAFKSKMPNFSDAQFTEIMGATQQYFIKGGNYRSETNGTFLLWQVYLHKDNKLYIKMTTSDYLFWTDAGIAKDEVVKIEVNKKVATVFGHECDEIMITTRNGTSKFYYNTGVLQVDATLYGKHKYQGWNEYLAKANALPLKIVIDNDKFSMEGTVTEIIPSQIDDKIFLLPADELKESPF